MVVRGFFVPRLDGGVPCYVDVLDNDCVGRVADESYRLFRDFLDFVAGMGGLGVEGVADCFFSFFEGGLPSERRRRHVRLLVGRKFGGDVLGKLGECWGKVGFFLRLPADTRPGLNFSSLYVHLRETGAVAYCLAVNRRMGDDKAQVARLAGLLHDLGKPVDWRNHNERGEHKVRELLGGVLDDGLVDLLCSAVRFHHFPDSAPAKARWLAQLVSEADVATASSDRVLRFAVEVLRGSGFDVDEERFGEWRFWESIGDDDVKRMTQVFGERSGEYASRWLLNELGGRGGYVLGEEGELAMVVGDARGIKRFVDGGNSLYEIKGGSILVEEAFDEAVYGAVLDVLPPECVLFSGGGNIMLICPADLADDVACRMLDAFMGHVKGGCGFTVDYLRFGVGTMKTHSFGAVRTLAMRKLAYRKRVVGGGGEVYLGSVKMCEACGERPAKHYVSERELHYCEACMNKYDVGKSERGLARVFDECIRSGKLSGVRLSDVVLNVMDFIAGCHPEKIAGVTRGELEVPDVSVVKADGNRASEFLARSLSITELVEKNILLDKVMGEVRSCVYDYAKRCGREFDEARLMFGEIYMGGDDLLWFVPGYLGIPVALVLISKFYELTGGVLTLSVAVVNSNARRPVYSMMEVAEWLLKNAKKLYMQSYSDVEQCAKGYIDFEWLTAGSPGRDGMESLRATIESWGLTCKPYFVPKDGAHLSEAALERDFTQLLRCLLSFDKFWESIRGNGNFKVDDEWFKELRSLARWSVRILNMFKSAGREASKEKALAMLYVMRETFRGGRSPNLLQKVFMLLNPHSSSVSIRLSDMLDLVKVLGGGISPEKV